MRAIRLFPLVPILLLAACNGEEEIAEESAGGEASGEILPGSISDEMIATDRLRSQPPLLVEQPAPPAPAEGDPEQGDGEAAGDTGDVPPQAPPA